VDDNSSDGTAEAVAVYSKTHPHVSIIKREGKFGLNSAVLDGFAAAKGKWFGVMDADLSHDSKILIPLIQALRDGHEMGVGSRRVKGGGADHWPWFRRFYSNVATWIARSLFFIPILDPLSGYFVLDRGVYERIKEILNPKGYKIL